MDIGEIMKPWMLLAIALLFLAGAGMLSTFEAEVTTTSAQTHK